MKKLLENLAGLIIVLAIIAAFGWVIAWQWKEDPLSCAIIWGLNFAAVMELHHGKS